MSFSDDKKPLILSDNPQFDTTDANTLQQDAPSEPRRCCRGSLCRRFLKTFIFVAISLFLFRVAGKLGRKWFCHHNEDTAEWNLEPSILSDIHTEAKCVENATWTYEKHCHGVLLPHIAKTSFNLPVSSDLLFLYARGSLSHGHVHILDSPDIDDVKVDIRVNYRSNETLDDANVCLLQPHDNTNGVGIFTPPRRWKTHRRRDQLLFNITVYLPSSPSVSPLKIEKFGTYLPFFAQRVGDLHGKVTFGTLALISKYMPLHIGSVSAERAAFKTSGRPITGSVNASSKLALVTTNAFIKANVGLKGHHGKNVTLFIKTKHAPIDASVSLFSNSKFKVTAKTSFSPLHLRFPHSALHAALRLGASTSNSPATVQLNPAYEGTFKLVTSLFRPAVDVSQVEDPSGRDRKREVETNSSSRGLLKGSVEWVSADDLENEKDKGAVWVKSSHSPVVLRL